MTVLVFYVVLQATVADLQEAIYRRSKFLFFLFLELVSVNGLRMFVLLLLVLTPSGKLYIIDRGSHITHK